MVAVKKIFLICLIGMIVLVLSFLNTKKGAVSDIDNRKLVEWKGDIEPYFKDRIGFRDQMINTYTVYNDRLFHEMVHPIYEYGKKGHVFFKFKKEVYDEEFIDLFCRYLKQVQDYCERRGVRFVYERDPSKPSIYGQYVAKGYRYKGRFYSLMSQKLDAYGVHYIDNIQYLKEVSGKEQVFNRKYNVGHWNDVGAFYGTNHLLEEMAKDIPVIQQLDKSEFDVDMVVEKSLPVSLFAINEEVPQYRLKDQTVLNITSEYQGVALHPKHGVFVVYQARKENYPNVLFFHSSYYNRWTHFYKNCFHKTYGVHCYENFLNFDYYYNLFKPDYVIFETGEYAVHAGFFNKQKLKAKVLNAPYDSVADRPHQKHPVSDLQGYTEEDKEKLVGVSFEIPEEMAFGYMFIGSKEYDLQVSGNRAEITLLKRDYNKDSVTVALFPVD